jgi:phage shock protein A
MSLLERVTTLVRANLNDLIDKAEDPEKMIKQVLLDMQNQLIQLKTQVAIAITDQHLLDKKRQENQDAHGEWIRKAEMAIDKGHDDLARSALERAVSYKQLADNFAQQYSDQQTQVETLKAALLKLEQKMAETRAKSEVLISQHRRARALSRASDAKNAMNAAENSATFDRLKHRAAVAEAVGQAKVDLAIDPVHDRLLSLSKQDEVDRLLSEIKARKGSK